MYSGPSFPGFHLLIGLAFVVFWLVVIAALFVGLYFVIRHAVTDGTLRADAIREGRPYGRHRRIAGAPPSQAVAPVAPAAAQPTPPATAQPAPTAPPEAPRSPDPLTDPEAPRPQG